MCVFFPSFMLPKGGSLLSPLCPSVWYLVRQITDNRWQWGEGQNPRTIILPCLFISYLPKLLSVWAISCKEQKGLKWNLVYRYMSVRGSAVHNNHTQTLNHLYFHNECLSGPYLVMYTRDWNKTCYIQRCCTSGVGLQVLPFIDNSVLGSIFSFRAIFLSFYGVP